MLPILLKVVAALLADFKASTYFPRQEGQWVGYIAAARHPLKVAPVADFACMPAEKRTIELAKFDPYRGLGRNGLQLDLTILPLVQHKMAPQFQGC